MTNFDCEKWISISDAVVLGDPITPAEREFEVAHPLSCARCRAEAAVWASLRPSRLHALPSAREIDEILNRLPKSALAVDSLPLRAPKQYRSIAGAGLAALALVAGVLFWLRSINPGQTPPSDAQLPASRALVTDPSAAPLAPPAMASASPETFAEDTCREVVRGITLCVAAGSQISELELSSPRRVVHLVQGRAIVSLVPQPAGTSFTVATKDGSVTAVGTKFAVEVAPEGGTSARVHHGKVVVRAPELVGQKFLVAGQALEMGSEKVQRVAARDRERDLRLLHSAAKSEVEVTRGAAPKRLGNPANDELERARALRSQGRFNEAAQVYRALHAASPGSTSGRAALVSLGALSLSVLGDPQSALGAFSGYLAGGRGALTKEAELGRVRALRALGRSAEAEAAMDAFMLRYPDAPESGVLQRTGHSEHGP